MTQLPDRRQMRWLALILFLATGAIYAQVATFDFTNYDDHFFVTENLVVQQGLTFNTLLWAFTDVSLGSWQPLTMLSHMMDCQLFGLSPAGHHLVSSLIHVINSAVLGYVLSLYTGAIWRSFLVATLFAVHPFHVESVAWVSERRDVLSGLFWLLSMWWYWIWNHNRRMRSAVLVGLFFLGGLMSKPIVVTLPVVFLLLDLWPLQRVSVTCFHDIWWQRRQLGALIWEKIPLLTLAMISGGVTIVAEESIGSIGTLVSYPMTIRVGNALLSYVRYLGKTVWPASLVPFYPYPEVLLWQVGLALVVLILITFFCLRKFNTHPYLLTGWLWYLVVLLPVIGIIQQGEFAMADRYTYLSLIGVFIMLVWGGVALGNMFPWWRREWSIGLAVCLVISLIAVTIRQTSFWRDTPTLFKHTLKEDPGNSKALLQLGAYHRDRRELEQAREYFVQVLRQSPRHYEAVTNLGDVYDKMGRADEAERYFQQALTINANDVQVYVNLGVLMARQGKMAAAVMNFERALALRPEDLKIRINLGGALYLLGKFAAAADQFTLVLRSDPDSADAYNGLGLVLMGQGRFADAVSRFQGAVRINPLSQSAQENLRSALAKVQEQQ